MPPDAPPISLQDRGSQRVDAREVSSAKDGRMGGDALEAASGFEPESRGFADLRLNHLATPPVISDYKRLGSGDQDAGVGRWCGSLTGGAVGGLTHGAGLG